MRKAFSVVCLLAACAVVFALGTPAWAATYYVTENGGGTSWGDTSAGNFQTLLENTNSGDVVYVAQGEYFLSAGETFTLKEGVNLYGGFKGTETNPQVALDARTWDDIEATRLNGLGVAGPVVRSEYKASRGSPHRRLDGFHITGGVGISGSSGGLSVPDFTNITVARCIFRNNTAPLGGAIYSVLGSYNILEVEDCIFINNSLSAIYTAGALTTISRSTFNGNQGGGFYGGAISGSGKVNIFNSSFMYNKAKQGDGGAICCNGADLQIVNCTFAYNSVERDSSYNPKPSGGIFSSNTGTNATIINSIFWQNTANNEQRSISVLAWSDAENASLWMTDSICTAASIEGTVNSTNIYEDAPLLVPLDRNMSAPSSSDDVYIFTIPTNSPAHDAGRAVGPVDVIIADNGSRITITDLAIPNEDQRGWGPRTTVDIGAYEFDAPGRLPAPEIPTITTTSLTSGTVGTAYSATLEASGTTPITWAVVDGSGSLPDGLSLNANTGLISGTPKTAGPSTFTVKAENAVGSVTKEFTITISPAGSIPTTGISLDKPTLSLNVNATGSLTATLTPTNATDAVTWTSSAPAIATVTGNGKSATVSAVAVGTATITATAGAHTAKCEVTVTKGGSPTPVPATGISLNRSALSLNVNGIGALTATPEPYNTTDLVIWSSSSPGIVEVLGNGKSAILAGLSTGSATITARAGTHTATCTVTVASGGGGSSFNVEVSASSLLVPAGLANGAMLTVTIQGIRIGPDGVIQIKRQDGSFVNVISLELLFNDIAVAIGPESIAFNSETATIGIPAGSVPRPKSGEVSVRMRARMEDQDRTLTTQYAYVKVGNSGDGKGDGSGGGGCDAGMGFGALMLLGAAGAVLKAKGRK